MKFWNKYHKAYNKFVELSPSYNELLNLVVKNLKLRNSDIILDAGCGPGQISKKLLDMGHEVHSIDNSKKALKLLNEKHKNAKLYHADLGNKLLFPNNLFDRIICINTLYVFKKKHLHLIVKEFYRIIKKGGIIVVTDPLKSFKNIKIFKNDCRLFFKNYGFFRGLFFIIKNIKIYIILLYFNKIIDRKAKGGFYNFFSVKDYISLFSKNNFRVINSQIVYAGQNIMLIAIKD
ncbi:MAG: class I SAM-dependent methyltransferase [Patescibacteria group bacterium]|nr:class I SAM-dependent methyltransferase [Patescibacteria group bacterium]